MSLGKINNVRFCDIHGGINEINLSVIYKKYANMEKTYPEWYTFLKNDFDLGEMKNISNGDDAKEDVKEVKVNTPKNK